MAEEHVVGRELVAILSFIATVSPDSDSSFGDDVGGGETCTKALIVGFFSSMIFR